MNGYICLKAITLGGIGYLGGDFIPAEAVLPRRAPTLIRQKCIAPAGEELSQEIAGQLLECEDTGALVHIPILREGGVLVLEMAPGEVSAAVELMQRTAEEAIAVLATVTCGDVLILVDALDQRKTVKAAAKARAGTLAEAEGTGDGGEG